MSTDQSNGLPTRTPGIVTAAFVLSVLGFVCGLPALIGLILGIAGRPKAKAAGSGVGLATAAIVIGAGWLLLFVVVGVVSATSSGSSSGSSPSAIVATDAPSQAPMSQAPAAVEPAEPALAEPTMAPEPESMPESVSQSNARESALSYVNYSAFSRTGLIRQLEYEGFSRSDATYGTDALNADWNEQAALSAQSYLDYSSFSRSGLIDQLIYEGFTKSQATYGVNAVGL